MKDILKPIIDDHLNKFIKVNLKKNLETNRGHSFTYDALPKEFNTYGACSRALDSSIGKLYELLIVELSKIYNEKTFTKYKDKTVDLGFERNGITNILQIKLGGDLDKGKSEKEKEILEETKNLLEEDNKKVKTYIGIINNKNGYSQDLFQNEISNWKQPNIQKVFKEDEILVERDLFYFITQDKKVFPKFYEITTEIIKPHMEIYLKGVKSKYGL